MSALLNTEHSCGEGQATARELMTGRRRRVRENADGFSPPRDGVQHSGYYPCYLSARNMGEFLRELGSWLLGGTVHPWFLSLALLQGPVFLALLPQVMFGDFRTGLHVFVFLNCCPQSPTFLPYILSSGLLVKLLEPSRCRGWEERGEPLFGKLK